MSSGEVVRVCLESGQRRVFACALDWPGWCRSGKGDDAALATLASYAPRYAVVTRRAGIPFPAETPPASAFEVVERLPGSGATDFGVPDKIAALDVEPLSSSQATRLAALVTASWEVFDEVAAQAPPVLRKGPRGGGRDRDKIVDHVVTSEAGYARKIGVRHRPPAFDDRAAISELRAAILTVLGAPCDGSPSVPKGWPHRYAARRIAWHVLDHAWEIEDRGAPVA